MLADWPLAYKMVRQEEGGDDDDPADHGGRTSRGITQSEYNGWRKLHGLSQRDVWSADEAEISAIYKNSYWDPLGDKLPAGVDLEVFDMNVISGPHRSAISLQRALNAIKPNSLSVDGQIGPATLAAVNEANPSALIVNISNQRRAFYQGLGQPRFLKGWLNRVSICQQYAMQALHSAGVTSNLPVGSQQVAMLGGLSMLDSSVGELHPSGAVSTQPHDSAITGA